MPRKVLFIQPFQFVKKSLSNEVLMWFIYLENYLKAKFSNIIMDVIYLPAEDNNKASVDIVPFVPDGFKVLHSVMDEAISNLDFNLDDRTYICLSGSTTFDYPAVKMIAEYLQKNYSKSILLFGGYHASSCPNDFNYLYSPIDYVITGEGEIALYNLIKSEVKKQIYPIIIEGSPIDNLNKLPPLDLTLLNKYINYFKNKARGLSISLSRGCPHNCSYCVEKNLVKDKKIKRWRAYTPKRAVQETNTLINYGLNQGIKFYGFLDPCFGYNKKWLNEFLDLYEVDIQIIYHFVETRIDILNEHLLSKLQKKKMFQFYGIDSFSKRMLEIMNKTHNPVEYLNQFNKVLAIHKNLEYNCNLGLLINHPGETIKTVQKTYNFLKDIKENDYNEVFSYNLTFYHLFAKTMNYEKLDFFNKKYGTKAYFPEWWKDLKTLKLGVFAVRSSSQLSLRDSINHFVEKQLEIDRIKYEKNRKDGFGLFFAKTSTLKKQRNDLIRFLDDHNIEVEDHNIYSV